jgi:hypothetical protein
VQENVIVTWGNDKNKNFLSEFICSARTIGKYYGKIIIVDYGIPEWFKQIFYENIEYIFYDINDINIETHKFISVLDFVSQYEKVAMFDADMWFQEDINNVFYDINENGILCASELNPFFYRFQENFFSLLKDSNKYQENFSFIKEKFGAQINAGFIAGKGKILHERLSKFNLMLKEKEIKKEYGADQLFLNIDFNLEKDNANMTKYNTIVTNTINFNNKLAFYKDNKIEISFALHIAASIFYIPIDIRKVLFRFRHKFLYNWFLKERGFHIKEAQFIFFEDDSAKETFISNSIEFSI